MAKFLRVKLEGCRVLEIDLATIRILNIDTLEDNTDYVLLAWTDTQMFELVYGNFDECHFVLNQIHELMDIEIIDLYIS